MCGPSKLTIGCSQSRESDYTDIFLSTTLYDEGDIGFLGKGKTNYIQEWKETENIHRKTLQNDKS